VPITSRPSSAHRGRGLSFVSIRGLQGCRRYKRQKRTQPRWNRSLQFDDPTVLTDGDKSKGHSEIVVAEDPYVREVADGCLEVGQDPRIALHQLLRRDVVPPLRNTASQRAPRRSPLLRHSVKICCPSKSPSTERPSHAQYSACPAIERSTTSSASRASRTRASESFTGWLRATWWHNATRESNSSHPERCRQRRQQRDALHDTRGRR